jgi:quinol monooxygenase YgiN
MIRLIAQYRIKEGAFDKVQKAVKKFVSAVNIQEPETEYVAYNLSNSNEFLHIMSFQNESAQQKHQNAAYTLEFVKALYPNCVDKPKFTLIDIVEEDEHWNFPLEPIRNTGN